MNELEDINNTTNTDLEAKAIKKELRRTVKNYSRVLDMIDAAPQFEEPKPKSRKPRTWRKFLNHFKCQTNKKH